MNPSHDLQGLKKKAKETFLYVLSALLLGIAIGAIDAVFGRVLLFITDFRSAHVVVLLPFLPLAGLGIVWLYRHFNETASKGMTLVMEAGQGKRESIPLALIPLVMAGTWITHLFYFLQKHRKQPSRQTEQDSKKNQIRHRLCVRQ